jgi:signal transduction histidine kinase
MGKADETVAVEGDIVSKDGLKMSIGITYALLRDTDGRVRSIIANLRDITNFRKAQEMQSAFISGVSHELRTPVALIKGHAATLSRDDVTWDTDFVREYSTIIEEESDRLAILIDDLLIASKLQANQAIEIYFAPVDITEVSRDVVQRFQVQTSKHQLELNFPDDFPTLQGDSGRLRQVMDNLVGNAIKYSPKGGRIEVGGKFTDEYAVIFVKDEGVGVPQNVQDQIFDRFYRVDDNLRRTTEGTGLGLYLAKAIIEAHDGKIQVESQPQRGSTFYFTLAL